MKVVRQITTQVDITSMVEMYSPDIESIILKHLQDRFVGVCYQSCLIQNIKKIVRRSGIKINQMAATGQGYIDVEFEVEAIEYLQNEGIVAKVDEMNEQYSYMVLNKDNHTAINMRRVAELKSVNIGNHLPLRVLVRKYQIAKQMISVIATLYTLPQEESYIFEIEPLTDEEKGELEYELDEIKKLEKQISKVDSKLLKFFNDLLYPFKNKKFTSLGSVEDMRKMKSSGLVVRHERTDKLEPDIIVLTKTKKNKLETRKDSAKLVYMRFFNDYKLHMMMMLELCSSFEEKALRDEHNHIWDIYKSYKKP